MHGLLCVPNRRRLQRYTLVQGARLAVTGTQAVFKYEILGEVVPILGIVQEPQPDLPALKLTSRSRHAHLAACIQAHDRIKHLVQGPNVRKIFMARYKAVVSTRWSALYMKSREPIWIYRSANALTRLQNFMFSVYR